MSGRGRLAALAVVVALLDWVAALGARALHMPFFLDSWATSTGVMVGGLAVGMAGGVLYNVVMAPTIWGSSAWVWSASSALVASSTFVFWRRGWVDIERPFRLVGAGVLTGLANAVLATAILHVRSLPEDPNTLAFGDTLQAALGVSALSVFTQEILVEIGDKTISLIAAASLTVLLTERPRRAPGG